MKMTNSYPYPYPDTFSYGGHNQHNWPSANSTPSYISSAAMNAINPMNSIGTGSNALTTLTNISAAVAAQNNPLLNHTTNSALTNGSLSNANSLPSVNNSSSLAGTMNHSNLSSFNMLGSTANNSSNSLSSHSETRTSLLSNFNHQKRKRRILFTQPQVSLLLPEFD